jgi:chemotaxis protein methyltransferase CheR
MMSSAPSGLWSSTGFEAVARFVTDRAGLAFPENRQPSIEAGICRSMGRMGVHDLDEYLRIIHAEGPPLDDLLAELTVGETYFFRESAQFTLLREEIIPKIAERRPPTVGLRAWSAACASGEEPYSIAITLREARPEATHFVLGTDISRHRLLAARRARYRRWSLRGVMDTVTDRYFRQHGDTYVLSPSVCELVDFRYLNLMSRAYPSVSTGIWGMDVIFCRNVLIYFDRVSIEYVGRHLLDTLSDDGYLLLGASDPVLSDYVRCEVISTRAGLAYRRASVQPRAPRTDARRAEETPWRNHQSTHEIVHPTKHPDPVPAPIALPPENTTAVPAGDERSPTPGTPSSEAEVVARVRTLANAGQFDAADQLCTSALERYRVSAELLYLHAILLLQRGNARDAAASARRALYADRSMIMAHITLSQSLARLGDTPQAVRALENAEQLLCRMASDAIVPASDGENAARLLAATRVQQSLLTAGTPRAAHTVASHRGSA